MGIMTMYTDPRKRTLQIIEVGLLAIAIVALILYAIPAIQDYQTFSKALAHHEKGHEYLHHDQTEEAIAEYEKAIAIYPKLAQSHEELAAIHHLSGHRDIAISVYRRAVNHIPDDEELRLCYSEALFLDGQYSASLAQAKIALALAPDDLRMQKMVARCQRFIANPKLAKHDQEMRKRRAGGKIIDHHSDEICGGNDGHAHADRISPAAREIEEGEQELQHEHEHAHEHPAE